MIQCRENKLSIRRSHIFKKRNEIDAFFKKAEKISGFHMNIFYSNDYEGNEKVAFFILKRTGKAYERIKSKRICREFYRNRPNLFGNKHIIFVIKRKISHLKDLDQFEKHLEKYFSMDN